MKTTTPNPQFQIKWPYIFKLVGFAIAIILIVLVFLIVEFSRRYVAHLVVWDCPAPALTPADIGLDNYELVQIQPQPDQMLTAWYIPSQNGAAVLLIQGHWRSRDDMFNDAELLARYGYGVMLLDPHPCAGPGVAHTMGHDEVADVAAAIKFMQQQPDTASGKIGVLGFSIGGVIAVESAAQIPEIQAVVAQGNFHDLVVNMTPRGARDDIVEGLVQRLMLFFYRYYTGLDPNLVKPIDSVAKISPRSLFLIAGQGEAMANHTQAQFEAAGQPKELWIVPETGHGGYQQRWPEEYEKRVIDFFDRSLLRF